MSQWDRRELISIVAIILPEKKALVESLKSLHCPEVS
jgi:hypothetical protein